jgi:tetratricopeptide (TPR) repeat protein
MVPLANDPQSQNKETYDQLISLIENSQGRLAPIIVACDDSRLRQQMVMRYEAEARRAKIRPYRIVLGQEPSLRAGLVALKQEEPHLQQGGEAVFTVTGAELLLRVKFNPQDEQSELDKFFGYLQWTREGLREFPYPIVLWVTERIFLEMRRRAPDFWSWRKATLRFVDESPQTSAISLVANPSQPRPDHSETEPLPPLTELQAEIAELTAKDANASGLAPLYDRLGQVYAQRISQGQAHNLEQDRDDTIAAFEQAIARYQTQNNPAAEMWTLNRLGDFFHSQSRYAEAIACHEKSLEIARSISDRDCEAASLCNLGITYVFIGQYQQAIDFYQQSLEIFRQIGDRQGEATSIGNLGIVYDSLKQYQRAIDLQQQSLEISREIGDRQGEATSIGSLGGAYRSLGQYQRVIALEQQSLEIFREIGGRHYEATSLLNLGITYDHLGQYQRAIDFYQQSLEIFREIGDRYGEGGSIHSLGNAYNFLEQYQRAIDFYQQSLEIFREIGDRHYEATALFNMAGAFAKLGQSWEAKQHYQQAKQIYQLLKLEHEVEKCNTAIYGLNQIIPEKQSIRPPQIRDESSPLSRQSSHKRRQAIWLSCFLAGLAGVLLVWWLRQ